MEDHSATQTSTAQALPDREKASAFRITGHAAYGCDHLQLLWSQSGRIANQVRKHFVQIQGVINKKPHIIAHTLKHSKGGSRPPFTSITSTYLCLQCPLIFDQGCGEKHAKIKQHIFSIESRSGCLYCHLCRDFVYDPLLEGLRYKSARPLLLPSHRNRKLDQFRSSSGEKRMTNSNCSPADCRTSGLRGLYNMGQTCFMSVTLQSLLHNPILRNWFLAGGHHSKECSWPNCASCGLNEIFAEFYTTDKVEAYGATTMLLRSWLQEQALAGYQQQDAHEYFQSLIQQLHTTNGGIAGTKSQPCNCIIHKSLYGRLRSRVTCKGCENATITEDPIMDLNLDLCAQAEPCSTDHQTSNRSEILSLKDCLERFTSPEDLEPNQYTCQNCSRTNQSAVKQLTLYNLPSVLYVQLKRFTSSMHMTGKVETKLKFPLRLDMSPFTAQKTNRERAGASETVNPCTYELASVVVHKGDSAAGHYISYCKKGDEWFLFDDSRVTSANESQVLIADAYLLIYIIRALC